MSSTTILPSEALLLGWCHNCSTQRQLASFGPPHCLHCGSSFVEMGGQGIESFLGLTTSVTSSSGSGSSSSGNSSSSNSSIASSSSSSSSTSSRSHLSTATYSSSSTREVPQYSLYELNPAQLPPPPAIAPTSANYAGTSTATAALSPPPPPLQNHTSPSLSTSAASAQTSAVAPPRNPLTPIIQAMINSQQAAGRGPVHINIVHHSIPLDEIAVIGGSGAEGTGGGGGGAAAGGNVDPLAGILSSLFGAQHRLARIRGAGAAGAAPGAAAAAGGAGRIRPLRSMEDILHHILMNERSHPSAAAATEAEISALPRLTVTAETDLQAIGRGVGACGITLDPFQEGQTLLELPCGHCFQQEAAEAWLRIHRTCPTCRLTLPSSSSSSDGNA